MASLASARPTLPSSLPDRDEKLAQGFVSMAQEIGLASGMTIEERIEALRLALSGLKKPQEVFDNIVDFQVLKHLPALVAWSDSTRLEPFSPEEGVQMIMKRLGNHEHAEIDDSIAADLAKRFAFYPLYMDQMASFMESDMLPLSEWYKQLDQVFGDQELQDIDPDSPWYSQSVAKAIEAHGKRLDTAHRLVLTTISFDPDNIPEQLVLS
ncbi:hypothetical protein VTJ49DRAFT_2457 [Mycothermus thermophilus]|uniref:Uncharacterized protein n=1 Tax=Humicola insolens TaxID=85995 RepID=A0ABR3V9V3_HUMIN